jgi:urease accessory protein
VVAYHGRGRPASWTVTVDVADHGSLIWHGEPFVVADGADVSRTVTITLGPAATLAQRETLVFGRTREAGGDLHTRSRAAVCGTPLLAEDLALHRAGRSAIGVLGGPSGVDRIVDSIAVLGRRPANTPVPPGVVRLDLDGEGAVFRWTGSDLAGSPLSRLWPAVTGRDRHPVSVGFGTLDG